MTATRVYRVTYLHEGGTSQGYGWFSSRRAAEAAAAAFRRRTKFEDGYAMVEAVHIETTKRGRARGLEYVGDLPGQRVMN